MDTVTCSKCGTPRPPELAQGFERPPCPHCGETSLTIGISLNETLSISSHASAELIPGNQSRDWNQRWKLIQDEIPIILQPHTTPMSGDLIHTSLQRLLSFFILSYHLKDALKDAAPGLGLKPSDVESAITNDARLALLADLANLDKHMKLTKAPRSGTVPSIEKISGVDDQASGGWMLSVQIKHGASTLDGLNIAKDAVNAWQQWLKTWGLI